MPDFVPVPSSQSYALKERGYPELLKGFHFIRPLLFDQMPTGYCYGLYQSDAGSLAFAKLWLGSRFHPKARHLKQEARVYQLMWQALNQGSLDQSTVRIPQFFGYFEGVQGSGILVEYIDGTILEPEDISLQVQGYAKSLQFLAEVSPRLLSLPKVWWLPRRGLGYWVWSTSLSVFGACFRRPLWLFRTIRTYGFFLWRLSGLAHTFEPRLSHTQLRPGHLMLRGDTIYLISLGRTALDHPLLDVVNLVLASPSTILSQHLLAAPELHFLMRGRYAYEGFGALASARALRELCRLWGRPAIEIIQFLQLWTADNVVPPMLTLQGMWLELRAAIVRRMTSMTDRVQIFPYDTEAKTTADRLRDDLAALVPELTVHLLGSVGLGIAGWKDIDIFIPCSRRDFRLYSERLTSYLGYPDLVRGDYLEWKKQEAGFEVDILLIDPQSLKYKLQMDTMYAIRTNPELLKKYETLKLSFHGRPMRAYETAKKNFFTEVEEYYIPYFELK